MNKKNISKLIMGVTIIGSFGFFSTSQVSAVCNDHQDKTTCLKDNKCEWEENVTTPECVGHADCLAFLTDKKKCLENKSKGCSWYVGCRDKTK